MSILIEGIDLPKTKNGDYIPMQIYGNGHIWINGAYKGVAKQIDLVRCKDCKYWADDMSGNMWCEHAIGGLTEATDFCSYGERRADEGITE